jgi:2'-5' RNA ligase
VPQAIVAALPEPHATQVADLWSELGERFGVHSHLTSEFPHFSLHLADDYDDTVQEKLQVFASTHPPLRVRTAGLGMFTQRKLVLHMPVVRNPRLNDFHRELWRVVSGLGDDVAAYYRPERWLPHITLALDRIDQYNLGGMIQWLSEQKLDWVFDVTELRLLEIDGDAPRVVCTAPLSGESPSGK